jgi:hypothetical protein
MFQNKKKKIARFMGKYQKLFLTLLLTLVIATCLSTVTYATTPKLVSGTVNLFKAITTWLLLIIPVGAGAVLGWQALQKALTDDQAVIAEKNKMMKNVIIGAAIAETASGLITIILSFYK